MLKMSRHDIDSTHVDISGYAYVILENEGSQTAGK